MERAWPKIWMIYVTLTFDQLTWKWYATHYSLMGCIGATYEANLSNNHRAMEWTWPKIWAIYVTLTYWPGNGTSHIVPSWVVFVPHMNIIHEIGNKPQSGHGMRDRLTEGWSETNIPQTTLLTSIVIICILTHWGRATHICVGKLTIIGSDNGLSPGRRHAIIWTIVGILLIGPLGTNFSEILLEIYIFSFKKMHLKVSSGKWHPFVLASMC